MLLFTIQKVSILIRKLTTNCHTQQYLHFTNWMQRFRLIEKHKLYTTTTTRNNNNIIMIYSVQFTFLCRPKRPDKTMGMLWIPIDDLRFSVQIGTTITYSLDYYYFFHPLLLVGWFVVFAKGKMMTSTQLYPHATNALC